MKIYLSGALASASDLTAACEKYDALAAALSAMGHSVYVPHHYTHPVWDKSSPTEVFERDSARLLASDVVIALLDDPSFGVGAEVALAVSSDVAVIGAVSQSRRQHVSRYILGLLCSRANLDVIYYDDIVSFVHNIHRILANLSTSRHIAPPIPLRARPRSE